MSYFVLPILLFISFTGLHVITSAGEERTDFSVIDNS